jgi:hypothetical protein
MQQVPPPRGVSRVVLSTAVALVLLQLIGVGHLAFGRHGICAEHGELIELDFVAPLPAPAPAPSGVDDRAQLVANSAGNLEHVHCPVLFGRRDATPVQAAVVRALSSVAAPGDATVPLFQPRDLPGRIRLAPKQSPPAA